MPLNDTTFSCELEKISVTRYRDDKPRPCSQNMSVSWRRSLGMSDVDRICNKRERTRKAYSVL